MGNRPRLVRVSAHVAHGRGKLSERDAKSARPPRAFAAVVGAGALSGRGLGVGHAVEILRLGPLKRPLVVASRQARWWFRRGRRYRADPQRDKLSLPYDESCVMVT